MGDTTKINDLLDIWQQENGGCQATQRVHVNQKSGNMEAKNED
jgi:hypothetical protein